MNLRNVSGALFAVVFLFAVGCGSESHLVNRLGVTKKLPYDDEDAENR